jgi:hypothetical protein
MAYTRFIEPSTDDSHQTSPAYVLTFVRWQQRDTSSFPSVGDFLSVKSPFVVMNDAIQVTVSCKKNEPSPTFSCRLRGGDINYATAIAPGDFVLVNMLDWADKAVEVRNKAVSYQPINGYNDGFKGLFKVNDVRKNLIVNKEGVKQYVFDITARGFDELNNLLYYNPAIVKQVKEASPLYFLSVLDEKWVEVVQNPGRDNIQELLKSVIVFTIGSGSKGLVNEDIPINKRPKFMMPPQLGKLINRNGSPLYASDINNYYIGIWQPSGGGDPASGFAGFFKPKGGNVYEGSKLEGSRQFLVADFQNVKVWSVLKNYSNPVLNEMYTTYRVGDDNHVHPSLVIRQKPFNTPEYGGITHTKFLDLPRWKISPELITALSLGRTDAARINFVQIFSRDLSVDANYNQAEQIKKGNFKGDTDDIRRSGMKPYIATCNYDYPSSEKQLRAPQWAELVYNWLSNGHLKMNGSIQTIGIQEPISIGDNLEFDGVVYHIESVTHNMSINPDGQKEFRTNITLSMGIADNSSNPFPVFGEMDSTDALSARLRDQQGENVLPGFSDAQDIPGRTNGHKIYQVELMAKS